MKAAAAAEGSASCNHRALERLLAGALAERQGPGAVGLPQQSGDRMHSASRRLQERRARQQHRRFSVSSESDDESLLGGGGATHETRPMPGFDWRQQLEQRQQMEQLEQRQRLSPMRRELPPPPPQHLEGPSVMEVVNMSIQELEAKAQQVEARAAQLASRAERPAEGDGRAGRGRPPAYERAAEGGGYAVDTAAESSDWELARLAQELPVVEARRAQHIGKLATRIDSALRHVDGLSTHLDDLASRPAPPPLPSTRAQSVRVDTAEPPQAGTGPISKAEQLLARLQDDERGDALEEGFEELSRAENIQTALVARLAAATNPSLRTELQLALAETTSTIADLRQQVRTLAAQTPAARETPSPSLQSDAGRATETGDFVIVGPTDQGPATLRRAPRPLLPPQRTSTIPDEMNRLPVSTPLVARTTAHPYAPQPGSPQQQEQVLKQAFRAMDTNHDGVISREEFAQGLKALQIDLHPDKLMEFLRLVDADVDGMINYYDFVQHFGTAKDGWDWAVTAAVHDQQLRTSLEWAVLRGQNDPVVISPDGWDRSDLQRSLLEPITLSTYLRRLNQSETRNPARTPGGDAADSASREQSSGRGHVCALPFTRAVDSMRSRVFGPIQAVRRSSQTWFCPRPHSFGDGLAGQMGESPMDCSA